jgi:hypothetical protein
MYKIVYGITYFDGMIYYYNLKKKKYTNLKSALQAFNDLKKYYSHLENIRIEHYYGRM